MGGLEIAQDLLERESLRLACPLERMDASATGVEPVRTERGGQVWMAREEILDRQRGVDVDGVHACENGAKRPVPAMTQIMRRPTKSVGEDFARRLQDLLSVGQDRALEDPAETDRGELRADAGDRGVEVLEDALLDLRGDL